MLADKLFNTLDAFTHNDAFAHAGKSEPGENVGSDITTASIRYKNAPPGIIVDPDAMRSDQTGGKAMVNIINNLTRAQRASIYFGAKNNLIQDYGKAGGDETYFNYMKGYIGSFLYSPYDWYQTGSGGDQFDEIGFADYIALNAGNVMYQGLQVLDGADTIQGAIIDWFEQNKGTVAAYWDNVNIRPELRNKWEIHYMEDPVTGRKFKVAAGFDAAGNFEVKYLDNKDTHPNDPEITIDDINKYNSYSEHGAPYVENYEIGQNPPTRWADGFPMPEHAYSFFSWDGWNNNSSISELNNAAENVTCRLSSDGKPLGKQEGWLYHGKKTLTITPESLGWTTGFHPDVTESQVQQNLVLFQQSAKTFLGGGHSDINYAPHVIKNFGHSLFKPYNATSYKIEADHYTHWSWVGSYKAVGERLYESKIVHTGPQTLCNGVVLSGPYSHPGHEGHSVHPAATYEEWNPKFEKWTEDYFYNAVITDIGHDDDIIVQNTTEIQPPPPLPPTFDPIPEPPITPTKFGDIIPLTPQKSSGGKRYRSVEDFNVVDCNGREVPKSDYILTDHMPQCLKVLRPPPCEVIVNVTWKEPDPVSVLNAISPPDFDPSVMPTLLPSSLFPWRTYEEFINFKKELAGSYYEGFDLMGDTPDGMPEWTVALQAQADLEWNDLLEMQSGYDSDFTNYTYTPGAGDLIYDEPHKIWTIESAAKQFKDYTNSAGVVEDWSGIPTNTNIPSTIRNVSSVTSGVVDGLYTYDKVTFEHNCPSCAPDHSQYPNNIWLKYEVFYNGVKI